jgi:hypothetical protein
MQKVMCEKDVLTLLWLACYLLPRVNACTLKDTFPVATPLHGGHFCSCHTSAAMTPL